MHLFVNNLSNVDFSYLHPERGLVGETWLASVILDGALDEQGMVCDFGIVKKTLRQWLDDTIDHSLVVPATSTQLAFTTQNECSRLTWHYGQDQQYVLDCSSPNEAITLIQSDYVNPQSVAEWSIEQLRSLLPDTIDRIQLVFKPEPIEHHFYHYSHGLKKHQGNCQRIAHGHRSTIEIHRNDSRDSALEKAWCDQWQDIYIGTEDDLVTSNNGDDRCYFQYHAEQGDFQLALPKQHCYMIASDTTVEYIAQHIAQQLKAQHPQDQFTVRAYEGIGKGAIASS